jgi:hypothetical protein
MVVVEPAITVPCFGDRGAAGVGTGTDGPEPSTCMTMRGLRVSAATQP